MLREPVCLFVIAAPQRAIVLKVFGSTRYSDTSPDFANAKLLVYLREFTFLLRNLAPLQPFIKILSNKGALTKIGSLFLLKGKSRKH